MLIIGLHVPAGSGKTTFCNAIKDSYVCRVVSFAESLKGLATQMGWNGEKDEKGRRLLQLLGTECGRECIDPDIWVKKWADKINKIEYGIVLVDDIRFLNEVKEIKKHHSILIKLINRGYNLNDTHTSEREIADEWFDQVIDSGSLQLIDFERTAKNLIKGLT